MGSRRLVLRDERGQEHDVVITSDTATIDGQVLKVQAIRPGELRIADRVVWVAAEDDKRWVFMDGRAYVFDVQRSAGRKRPAGTHDDNLSAPMPATVVKLHVVPGDEVRAGQLLLVLEAMKMELPVRAAADARVERVRCREGELVQPGQPLIELAPLAPGNESARK